MKFNTLRTVSTISLLTATLALTFTSGAHAFSLEGVIAKAAGKYVEKKFEPQGGRNNQSAAPIASGPTDCTVYDKNVGTPQYIGDATEGQKIIRRARALCRENYLSYFDPATKTPLWVAERVSRDTANHAERSDNFQPDPEVPGPAQASLNDYKGSGFDRGHMAPAADMLTDSAMAQSFYLTNMVPQVGPNMNRGIWADLEKMVRGLAQKDGEVWVYTGPIFDNQVAVIGRSQVWVPSKLFKIIYRPATGQTLSFIMPNVQIATRKTHQFDAGNSMYPQTTPQAAMNCGSVCTPENFKVSLAAVEQATRWKFFPKVPNAK